MTAEKGRILVTGGLGALGIATVRSLHTQGFDVRFIDLPTHGNRMRAATLPRGIERVFGDITSADDVAQAMRGVTGVVHLAAMLPPASERFGERTRRVNVDGTARLVDAARKEGVRGPFILTSSCTVYGPDASDGRVMKVTDPVVGTDHYTSTKVEAEGIVRAGASLPTILRLGVSIESARTVTDSVVLRQLFEIAPDNPIELVHADDVARAVVNAVSRAEAHGQTFNVGGGARCQVHQRDLLRALETSLAMGPLPANAFGVGRSYTCHMDTEASQRVLDFQRHDYDSIVHDLGAKLRLLRPLLGIAAPITRRVLLRYSGPLRGAPSRPTWAELIESEARP